MTQTYLLIAALPSRPNPYLTYLKSPQKNFRRWLYNFLCVKLLGQWTKSHQIFARCTEMIADTTLKSKLRSSNPIWNTNEWRSSSNCGRITAKFALFNGVNSEVIIWMLTKSVHDMAGILPFNSLKANIRSANPLSNDKAYSKSRSWRCLRTFSKFNWLP